MLLRGTTRFPKRVRDPVQRLEFDSTISVQPAKATNSTVAKRRTIKQSPIVGKKLTFSGSYFQVKPLPIYIREQFYVLTHDDACALCYDMLNFIHVRVQSKSLSEL